MEKMIKHATWHTLNFLIIHLVSYCFRIAFKWELRDLDGLISPDSFCEIGMDNKPGSIEVEMELLEILEDDHLDSMRYAIVGIIEYRDRFVDLNNLDVDEVLYNLDAIDLANRICDGSLNVSHPKSNYQKLVKGRAAVYYDLFFALYSAACMLMAGKKMVVNTRLRKQFNQVFDELIRSDQYCEDENAGLLLELMAELEKDCLNNI